MENRIIKFRAWHKNMKAMLTAERWHHYGPILVSGELSSDDHVVMQFTGLRDKNGVEIWEGDVIHIKQGQCVGHEQVYEDYREIWKPITGPVIFDDGAFSFEGHDAGTLPLFAYIDEIEVIGNIFQHPELLSPHKP